MLCIIILLTWLSVKAIKRKEPAGVLYLAAFGLSNIGYTTHFLRLLGLMPVYWWNLYGVQLGTLTNMVLMTLALTERLHIAEQQAVVAARASEHKATELALEMTKELRHKQQGLEQALANEHAALEQKNSFLMMLSHEYRTPLAIIQANLDLLELQQHQEGLSPEPRHTSMRYAVKRLVEVMETSLKKDRLDVLDSGSSNNQVLLIPFLDEVIDEAEGFWPDRFFIFHPEEKKVQVAVTMDAAQLKTALLNLLDNACKYSPLETPINIACISNDTMAIVTVCNQSKGIFPGEAEAIFEKYQRGSTSQGTSGAGLGLWLVRQIVEQQGGSITLSDDNECGTIATLSLPVSL